MKYKRIILIVLDSLGIGEDKHSKEYGDINVNTFVHVSNSVNNFNINTLNSLGLFDLDSNIKGTYKVNHPNSFVCKLNEKSNGKDTLTGHWEMMGVYTTEPFKTFTNNGFPKELILELKNKTRHEIIGNYAFSGTEIIKKLGEEQMRDNSLIVYTSSDSVLQIAAHEEKTGLNELYRCCEIAREICMKPEWMVGRVIARPFLGNNSKDFYRTANRHDYAVKPQVKTVMNLLDENGYKVSAVGKINDIFDGYGVNETFKSKSNSEGMNYTSKLLEKDFTGLVFVNLVEFDSEYGHRRNAVGYAKAIEMFDSELSQLMNKLNEDDLLILTADHGNDPTYVGTDHTREKVPLIAYSKSIKNGKLLNERNSFADIGASILKNFSLKKPDYLLGEFIEELFE